MAAAMTTGKRSEFSVSAEEREIQAQANKRLAGAATVTLYTRDRDGDAQVFFVVLAAGSQRRTMTRQYPVTDADEVVAVAQDFARRAGGRRGSQWTEDPGEADAQAFV